MAIKFASNIESMRAQRQLGLSTSDLTTSFQRLSSGLRVNRSADDAAGLAVATGLEMHGRVYTQGVRNISDGISYLRIADSALIEARNILSRQKEIAGQAASGSLAADQRAAMQREMAALGSEYDRIIESTRFNGISVFNRNNATLSIQAGFGIEANILTTFDSSLSVAQDDARLIAQSDAGVAANALAIARKYGISEDGRYVVFESTATNLVAGDANGAMDIFLRDNLTGETTLISKSFSGGAANGASSLASISSDGRYVTYQSLATNIVADDTNGVEDVFRYDVITGVTELVSVSDAGAQGNNVSAGAHVSGDGRYVAFQSNASNLVAGDTNAAIDIFVKDMISGEVKRASVSSSGTQGNANSGSARISDNGRYVSFNSTATNLVAGDTNGFADYFVYDLFTGTQERVSVSTAGAQANGGDTGDGYISADGRFVVFQTGATNLVAGDTNGQLDVFMRDRLTGQTTLVSVTQSGTQGNNMSTGAMVSADGRYVSFQSFASNLASGDGNGNWDAFVKDTVTGELVLVSRNSTTGAVGNSQTDTVGISKDGRFISFNSAATNLAPGVSGGYRVSMQVGNPLDQWSHLRSNVWLGTNSAEAGQASLARLDEYIGEITILQGSVGAALSRLEIATSNLQASTMAFNQAYSRIMDADMASETANLIRGKIRQNAARAVIAQANQNPAIVLRLLQG